MRGHGRMPQAWTFPQRLALCGLALFLAAVVGIQCWFNPLRIENHRNAPNARADELMDRIDPNTADWPVLAIIPGMGEKRAKSIVDYRRQFLIHHPGQLPFAQNEDLMNVKGIGPATLANAQPYLLLPTTRPGK